MGLVCVSSVAAERIKDGTDLVRHPDIVATAMGYRLLIALLQST